MKQDIISYMFNVEDTRTKSMFKKSNTLISKLDTVYRYTVFNGKPVYGFFYTHIA